MSTKAIYALLFLFMFTTCEYRLYSQDQQSPSTTKEKPAQPAKPSPFDTNLPAEKDQDFFFQEFFNMLSTLGIIVVALLFLTWLLKKMANTRIQQLNLTSHIKIIEKRNLSPKTLVYLLEIEGKTLLIGETHAGLSKLAEFSGSIATDEDIQR